MAKTWKTSAARPVPTSITEIARRYHACALALSQTLGLPVAEVLKRHGASVTAIFIETGRCEIRLPARVALPPLVEAPGVATPEPLKSTVSDDGHEAAEPPAADFTRPRARRRGRGAEGDAQAPHEC